MNSEEKRGKRMKNEQTEQLIAFDITRMVDGCGVKGSELPKGSFSRSRLFKWRMKTQIILIQVDSMLHGWCSWNDEWVNREWHNDYSRSDDDDDPFSGYSTVIQENFSSFHSRFPQWLTPWNSCDNYSHLFVDTSPPLPQLCKAFCNVSNSSCTPPSLSYHRIMLSLYVIIIFLWMIVINAISVIFLPPPPPSPTSFLSMMPFHERIFQIQRRGNRFLKGSTCCHGGLSCLYTLIYYCMKIEGNLLLLFVN